MTNAEVAWIAHFIWGIADDVLRDLYVRGKYRDVILPMIVLRRLDAVLEPNKVEVLAMKENLDTKGIVNQEAALKVAAKQPFYNTSRFSLRDLRSRTDQRQLKADFEDYLEGFSSNVQDILTSFEFRNQVPRLSKSDALGTLIEKFLDPNLKLSSLDNHAMGSVFEELVRRFNEENNEEAGEHWTPRDAVKLMANLIFRPIADQITDGTYLLYDAAAGTGGMLTVAEATLTELAEERGKRVSTHLYGQEINAETYAICKADLLLSGEGENADNIVGGPEHSTLSNDAFKGRKFDFMLSNPPYGKSWKTDLERMGGKGGITDRRFTVDHAGDPAFSLITRSNDGQMLFLANMISKMKHDSTLGSRIAEVHSGSSLFTGDAGQGESNVRRWILENDWLEAIIQLPLNMFYNTGIATYIWVLSNRKPEQRRGKVQLIDASGWFSPLRRNLGQKNCELSDADTERIVETFLAFEETEQSKIFDNAYFGYRKVRVERPLRLRSQCSPELVEQLRFASGDQALRSELHDQFGDQLFDGFAKVRTVVEEYLDGGSDDEDEDAEPRVKPAVRKRLLDEKRWARDKRLHALGERLAEELGAEVFDDHNEFALRVNAALTGWGEKLGAADRKTLLRGLSWRDEQAPPVVKKVSKGVKAVSDPLHGRFEVEVEGKPTVMEYEADPELSDFEQVPLLEPGGVAAFIAREVMPYAPDAWVDEKSESKIGYEISFTRHFYKPATLRPLSEIEADIRKLLVESDGLVERALDA
ncbi:class I SAM-dependent DNA methyltransferase [Micromonospora sp. C41]|uniref:type I restriction-modification system subunit M n=1 Tax=Micromonospora sp. C41 TaxID=2824878 RepID=UPI001B39696E|nr:class I SAM-dependent DNA methyltransferase [Micromonospora sp. C41]MBQ1062641.1 SAM-dependent DNA methyltransferase [Micromonospora sp. C41]